VSDVVEQPVTEYLQDLQPTYALEGELAGILPRNDCGWPSLWDDLAWRSGSP
jgi:hypothetical protein